MHVRESRKIAFDIKTNRLNFYFNKLIIFKASKNSCLPKLDRFKFSNWILLDANHWHGHANGIFFILRFGT